jgi:hypothetical protein
MYKWMTNKGRKESTGIYYSEIYNEIFPGPSAFILQ